MHVEVSDYDAVCLVMLLGRRQSQWTCMTRYCCGSAVFVCLFRCSLSLPHDVETLTVADPRGGAHPARPPPLFSEGERIF